MDLHQWLRMMMMNETMELDSVITRFLQEPYTNKLRIKRSSKACGWAEVRAKTLEELLMTARCSLSLRIISQQAMEVVQNRQSQKNPRMITKLGPGELDQVAKSQRGLSFSLNVFAKTWL